MRVRESWLTDAGGRSRGRSGSCWPRSAGAWPFAFFLRRFSWPLDFVLWAAGTAAGAAAVPLTAGLTEAMAVRVRDCSSRWTWAAARPVAGQTRSTRSVCSRGRNDDRREPSERLGESLFLLDGSPALRSLSKRARARLTRGSADLCSRLRPLWPRCPGWRCTGRLVHARTRSPLRRQPAPSRMNLFSQRVARAGTSKPGTRTTAP